MRPTSESCVSVVPCMRLSRFHSVSPWRITISVVSLMCLEYVTRGRRSTGGFRNKGYCNDTAGETAAWIAPVGRLRPGSKFGQREAGAVLAVPVLAAPLLLGVRPVTLALAAVIVATFAAVVL